MDDSTYWWAAIWPDGSITRGCCQGLGKATKKTERCVACSIQMNKDAVTGMLPTLEKKYKNWGAESWKVTDTSDMRYSQAKRGFHRRDYKPSRKHVKKSTGGTA